MAKKKAKKPATTETQKETEDAEKEKQKASPKRKFQGHFVISKTDDPRAQWYVIHTYSGHELKVSNALQQRIETMNLGDKIFEILIPTQETFQIRAGKKLPVTEKIFPGYMLVKMIVDDQSWLTVRTTQGVTGFVGAGNKPTPISKDEVKTIQEFMSLEAPKYKAKFTLGEAVKIVDGPFADFLGTIDNIDEDKGKLRVLVSIFGRETPVELDFLQVKKI